MCLNEIQCLYGITLCGQSIIISSLPCGAIPTECDTTSTLSLPYCPEMGQRTDPVENVGSFFVHLLVDRELTGVSPFFFLLSFLLSWTMQCMPRSGDRMSVQDIERERKKAERSGAYSLFSRTSIHTLREKEQRIKR